MESAQLNDVAAVAADVDHGLAVASDIYPALVRHMLTELDQNGDGQIDASELHRLGELLGERSWDEATVKRIFAESDTDGNGFLSYDEFYRWLAHHTQRGAEHGVRRRDSKVTSLQDINPDHLALFNDLDLGAGHRLDVITPERETGLASHLLSVYTILKEWGAEEQVCTAGMFHSVYEVTGGDPEKPHHACDIKTDRPKLQNVIGETAEKLAYLFQPANRSKNSTPAKDGLWDAPLGSDFILPGCLETQPERIECPAALRGPLCYLYWANMLDQSVPPATSAEELNYASDKLMHSYEVLPLFTGAAGQWVERLKATIVAHGRPQFEELAWTKQRAGWLVPGGEPVFWLGNAPEEGPEREIFLLPRRDQVRCEMAARRARWERVLTEL